MKNKVDNLNKKIHRKALSKEPGMKQVLGNYELNLR